MNIEKYEVIGQLTTAHNIEGISHPLIVLKNNKKYIAKGLPLTNKKVYNYVMFNEIISSLVAPYFKVNIPDYFINYYNNAYWYCSEYIEGVMPQPKVLQTIPNDHLANIAIFDIFLSNRDRRFCNMIYTAKPLPKLWLIDHGRCLLAPLTNWEDLNIYPINVKDLILIPALYDALKFSNLHHNIKIDWDSVYSKAKSIPEEWLPNGEEDIDKIIKVLQLRKKNLLEAINKTLHSYKKGDLKWNVPVI